MRERTPFPRSVLERLPNLRLLVTTGMRDKSFDLEAAAELGIVVSGTDLVGTSTVELTWSLILAVVRNTCGEDRRTRAGQWQQFGLDVFDVEPLPEDHPLLSTPRTVLSPRMGFVFQRSLWTAYWGAVEDVLAWLAGTPLRVLNGPAS